MKTTHSFARNNTYSGVYFILGVINFGRTAKGRAWRGLRRLLFRPGRNGPAFRVGALAKTGQIWLIIMLTKTPWRALLENKCRMIDDGNRFRRTIRTHTKHSSKILRVIQRGRTCSRYYIFAQRLMKNKNYFQ